MMRPSVVFIGIVLLLGVVTASAQDARLTSLQNTLVEKQQALDAHQARMRSAKVEITSLQGDIQVAETAHQIQEQNLELLKTKLQQKQKLMLQAPEVSVEPERQAYAAGLAAYDDSKRHLEKLRQDLVVSQSQLQMLEVESANLQEEWNAARREWRAVQAAQLREKLEREQHIVVEGEVGCDRDLSIGECQRQALDRTLANAAEQGSAVLVSTLSEVKNLQLTRDEIRTQSKALVLQHRVLEEGTLGKSSGYFYKIQAIVKGQVTDQLLDQLIIVNLSPTQISVKPTAQPVATQSSAPSAPRQPSPQPVLVTKNASSELSAGPALKATAPLPLSGRITKLALPAASVHAKLEPAAPEPPRPTRYRLTIHTTPPQARVRIMNIGPPYRHGIELEPRDYDIIVDHPGYSRHRQVVTVANADVNLDVTLKKRPVAPQPSLAANSVGNREAALTQQPVKASQPKPHLRPSVAPNGPSRQPSKRTQLPTESKQVARAEPQLPSTPPVRRRSKLAFLPIRVIPPRALAMVEERAMKLISQAIADTDLFELSFSYLRPSPSVSTKQLRKVWSWTGKLKLEAIYDIGKELGVDAVVLYAFDLDEGPDDMDVFLVNLRDKKHYQLSVTTEGEFWKGEGYYEGLELTRQVFNDYKKDMR